MNQAELGCVMVSRSAEFPTAKVESSVVGQAAEDRTIVPMQLNVVVKSIQG